ncbi:MAG: S8 family serine peptidase, partial [Actinomycetota bacterium]|nr:S8 family serine peptidase [Actinomycetota bacterium]
TGEPRAFAPRTRVLRIRDGESVRETIGELRRRPGVLSATPNWIARASAFVPDDPGQAGAPGGWQGVQWNFEPGTGINTPDAWERLNVLGRPGGQGVKVAVLDTGVAYASRRGFRRSPDLGASRFLQGYDFVDNDAFPDDQNGHGTHVASTIGESTGNGFGVTGVAYGARIMPVRVLDRAGAGDSVAISAGIRYAARRGASVINLSFEFDSAVTRGEIPDIFDALRYARRKGALVVGASGNFSAHAVAYPARAGSVLSVAATTEHVCQADYSNGGADLDIAAPGGGLDAEIPGDPNCRPGVEPAGRDILQMTFAGRSVKSFGLPGGYVGTSMAAPHVSGTAALVIASGVIGPNPTPAAIEARLKATARDLGTPGPDTRYGAGLVDAARAVTP